MKRSTIYKVMLGFLLCSLDYTVTIGSFSFDVLPNFLGLILLFWALLDFSALTSGFHKLMLPLLILFFYHAFSWIAPSLLQAIPATPLYILQLFMTVFWIVFWFFYLTGIIALIRQHGEKELSETLRGIRNVYSCVQIGFLLTANVFLVPLMASGLAMVNFAVMAVILYELYQFASKFLKDS